MRIILYTGKGGVGKTSVAAATAVRAAELGYRTVAISTDAAHSLADSFDVPLGPTPAPVAPSLWGQEVDVLRELDVHWKTVREWLVALMQWQGTDDLIAEEVAILPGMEELVGLLYISRYAESNNYDLLVVDCAPTGETLRLLSFPEMARWYVKRLLPVERRVAATVGPVIRGIVGLPVPSTAVFDAVEDLFRQLDKMQEILSDGDNCSVRLVVNPERMVIKETQRTYTYLNLYGYSTDLVVCNRVIPETVQSPFFDSWKTSQVRHLQFIHECFDPIPIFNAPLLDHEVVGLEPLRELAAALFGDRDPAKLYYSGQSQKITREASGYVMTFPIPFTAVEDVAVTRNGTELVVQLGHYRRNILLPNTLAALPLTEAKKEGATLKLTFHGPDPKPRPRRATKGGKS